MYLEGLASCAELTTEHAAEAAESSTSMRTLLAWASRIARPGEGAPKLLMAMARLARAEWVDGAVYLEISGHDLETSIARFTDHGTGIRERLLPPVLLRVSVEEFMRAVRLAPQLIAPLHGIQRGDKLILAESGTSIDERPSIPIAATSLLEHERKTTPPPGATSPAYDTGLHTHPTVRRMVAVRPEALRDDDDDD
jgi:hypothetical protein